MFGLAAATTMLKSQRISPGKRVVVAGAGPLLATPKAEAQYIASDGACFGESQGASRRHRVLSLQENTEEHVRVEQHAEEFAVPKTGFEIRRHRATWCAELRVPRPSIGPCGHTSARSSDSSAWSRPTNNAWSDVPEHLVDVGSQVELFAHSANFAAIDIPIAFDQLQHVATVAWPFPAGNWQSPRQPTGCVRCDRRVQPRVPAGSGSDLKRRRRRPRDSASRMRSIGASTHVRSMCSARAASEHLLLRWP